MPTILLSTILSIPSDCNSFFFSLAFRGDSRFLLVRGSKLKWLFFRKISGSLSFILPIRIFFLTGQLYAAVLTQDDERSSVSRHTSSQTVSFLSCFFDNSVSGISHMPASVPQRGSVSVVYNSTVIPCYTQDTVHFPIRVYDDRTPKS